MIKLRDYLNKLKNLQQFEFQIKYKVAKIFSQPFFIDNQSQKTYPLSCYYDREKYGLVFIIKK